MRKLHLLQTHLQKLVLKLNVLTLHLPNDIFAKAKNTKAKVAKAELANA